MTNNEQSPFGKADFSFESRRTPRVMSRISEFTLTLFRRRDAIDELVRNTPDIRNPDPRNASDIPTDTFISEWGVDSDGVPLGVRLVPVEPQELLENDN